MRTLGPPSEEGQNILPGSLDLPQSKSGEDSGGGLSTAVFQMSRNSPITPGTSLSF